MRTSVHNKQVEDFCRLFNWVKPPSKLERSSNYHLFKSDIKPMWEDPANANVRGRAYCPYSFPLDLIVIVPF